VTGTVFDIKGFALHDGPGIRTTVFLKGCPLRCLWCHNPEGLSPEPQLCVKKAACTGCGLCMKGCTHPDCQPFGRCLHICPNGCVSAAGEIYTPEALAERLCRDKDVFAMSGGGVTFSGGEPLMQAGFVCAVSDILRAEGIHLAVETCGYAGETVFRQVLDRMDFVMMDIKLEDPILHKRYIGVDNSLILANLRTLQSSGKPYRIRTPLIPGITDTEENLNEIKKLIGDADWEKLPYNTLAGAKYENFGMRFGMERL